MGQAIRMAMAEHVLFIVYYVEILVSEDYVIAKI